MLSALTRSARLTAARPALARLVPAAAVRPVALLHSTPHMWAGDDLTSAAADATYISAAAAEERVLGVIKDFEKVEPAKVTPTSHFIDDLGLDSLDTVELVMAFEEEFMVEMDDAEAEKIFTVSDAVSFFSTHPMAK
eukprot:COSAG01_NODE_856_length_13082_cov_23.882009_10_plen_137_part_00